MTETHVLALNPKKDGTNVWDRLEGEPEAAWDAFKEYRELAPDERTVVAVARKMDKNESGLRRWSKRYQWAERARAFDGHLDTIEIDAILLERVEASKRRIKLADSLLQVAEAQLQSWLDDLSCGIKLDLTPYEVARIIEIGYKIDRLERGESTDNMAVKIRDDRLTDLTQEELMERARCILENILTKQK